MTLYKKISAVLFSSLITYLPCVGNDKETSIEKEEKNHSASSFNKENINSPSFSAELAGEKVQEYNIGPSQRRIGYWYNVLTPEQLRKIHTNPKNAYSSLPQELEIKLPDGFETESETDSEEARTPADNPSTPNQSKEAHTQ